MSNLFWVVLQCHLVFLHSNALSAVNCSTLSGQSGFAIILLTTVLRATEFPERVPRLASNLQQISYGGEAKY